MPNTREKLVELLKTNACPAPLMCDQACRYYGYGDCFPDRFADHLIANGVTVQEWISVKDRLPEAETEVMILAEHKTYSFKGTVTTRHTMTTGMYEDGRKNTEDSEWMWETDGFDYDEELDAYIIPEGWWEYKHYNGDDEYNNPIDDTVTHWMPLPKPPKGE